MSSQPITAVPNGCGNPFGVGRIRFIDSETLQRHLSLLGQGSYICGALVFYRFPCNDLVAAQSYRADLLFDEHAGGLCLRGAFACIANRMVPKN